MPFLLLTDSNQDTTGVDKNRMLGVLGRFFIRRRIVGIINKRRGDIKRGVVTNWRDVIMMGVDERRGVVRRRIGVVVREMRRGNVIMMDVDEKRMGVVVKKRRGVIWNGVASEKRRVVKKKRSVVKNGVSMHEEEMPRQVGGPSSLVAG